ncbi:hypothetical protein VTO42DRAFT_3996 [Malbranchea cinnamomea]
MEKRQARKAQATPGRAGSRRSTTEKIDRYYLILLLEGNSKERSAFVRSASRPEAAYQLQRHSRGADPTCPSSRHHNNKKREL